MIADAVVSIIIVVSCDHDVEPAFILLLPPLMSREEAYHHATTEPHDCLVIDTHPETSIDKRLSRNFDNVLIVQ